MPLALAACDSAGPVASVDLRTVDPGGKPNRFLLTPASYANPHADGVSPVFAVDPDRLFSVASAVIAAQPRTTIRVSDPGLRRAVAVQRSAVFGFADDVDVAVEAAGPGQSSLALFSRSRLGYWDLGVNRRRVLDWLTLIEAALPPR